MMMKIYPKVHLLFTKQTTALSSIEKEEWRIRLILIVLKEMDFSRKNNFLQFMKKEMLRN